MDPDRSLVLQAAAGSRPAFDELVERYGRRVYNLVRALSGNHPDVEDLVQDIFVRVYRSLHGFRGDSSFRSWLYRVSVNVVQNHRDSRAFKEMARGLDLQSAEGVPQLSKDDDLEGTMARRQGIDRALATLPPDMRLLVILRDVHGLSYDEIARIVKMRPGTVDSKLFRARQRLRPMLEQYVSRANAAIRGGVGTDAGRRTTADFQAADTAPRTSKDSPPDLRSHPCRDA